MDFVEKNVGENENKDKKSQAYEDVRDFFSPLHEHWSAIQEILVWQNLEVAIVCFNIVNGLFWLFLSPGLRTCVSFAIFASLLWLFPPWRLWVLSNARKLSAKRGEHLNADSEAEMIEESQQDTSGKTKVTSYEDFCHGIALLWRFVLKYYVKLKNMKDEKRQQFFALLAFCVISLAIIYQSLPIGNLLYLTTMFLFLWPAIVFYGVKDIFVRKLRKLFKPFYTQWQNCQTKRKRDVTLKGRRDSDISDVEDEFNFNPGQEPTKKLGPVLPVERLRESHYDGHFDSLNSSTISTDGLEFPSLRRDSVESYNSDDFIDGLNFGSFNADAGSCHSSLDSLVGEQEKSREHAAQQEDPKKDEQLQRNQTEWSPAPVYVAEQVRSRKATDIVEQSPSLSRNKSSDSLQSYEIVETSEIETVLAAQNERAPQERSYLASGAGYVGKLFGYNS